MSEDCKKTKRIGIKSRKSSIVAIYAIKQEDAFWNLVLQYMRKIISNLDKSDPKYEKIIGFGKMLLCCRLYKSKSQEKHPKGSKSS